MMKSESKSSLAELKQDIASYHLRHEWMINDDFTLPEGSLIVDEDKLEIKIHHPDGCTNIPLSKETSIVKGYINRCPEWHRKYVFTDETNTAWSFSVYVPSYQTDLEFEEFKRLVDKYKQVDIQIECWPTEASYLINTESLCIRKVVDPDCEDLWYYSILIYECDLDDIVSEVYVAIDRDTYNHQISENTYEICNYEKEVRFNFMEEKI